MADAIDGTLSTITPLRDQGQKRILRVACGLQYWQAQVYNPIASSQIGLAETLQELGPGKAEIKHLMNTYFAVCGGGRCRFFHSKGCFGRAATTIR